MALVTSYFNNKLHEHYGDAANQNFVIHVVALTVPIGQWQRAGQPERRDAL